MTNSQKVDLLRDVGVSGLDAEMLRRIMRVNVNGDAEFRWNPERGCWQKLDKFRAWRDCPGARTRQEGYLILEGAYKDLPVPEVLYADTWAEEEEEPIDRDIGIFFISTLGLRK